MGNGDPVFHRQDRFCCMVTPSFLLECGYIMLEYIHILLHGTYILPCNVIAPNFSAKILLYVQKLLSIAFSSMFLVSGLFNAVYSCLEV